MKRLILLCAMALTAASCANDIELEQPTPYVPDVLFNFENQMAKYTPGDILIVTSPDGIPAEVPASGLLDMRYAMNKDNATLSFRRSDGTIYSIFLNDPKGDRFTSGEILSMSQINTLGNGRVLGLGDIEVSSTLLEVISRMDDEETIIENFGTDSKTLIDMVNSWDSLGHYGLMDFIEDWENTYGDHDIMEFIEKWEKAHADNDDIMDFIEKWEKEHGNTDGLEEFIEKWEKEHANNDSLEDFLEKWDKEHGEKDGLEEFLDKWEKEHGQTDGLAEFIEKWESQHGNDTLEEFLDKWNKEHADNDDITDFIKNWEQTHGDDSLEEFLENWETAHQKTLFETIAEITPAARELFKPNQNNSKEEYFSVTLNITRENLTENLQITGTLTELQDTIEKLRIGTRVTYPKDKTTVLVSELY